MSLRLAREFQSALSEGGDRSINTRAALTMNGLWMMYSTAGRGVGAAGFTDVLVSADVPFRLAIPKREGFLAHNL